MTNKIKGGREHNNLHHSTLERNKEENVHIFAVRGELYRIEREKDKERDRNKKSYSRSMS